MYAKDEPITGAVKEKGLTKYHAKLLAILFIIWTTNAMGMGLYPLVRPLIFEEWGLTHMNLGFIDSIMPIGATIGLLLFGALADYLGGKRLLAISVLGGGLSFIISLSQDWVQLGIALAISHFATASINALVFSMAAEELPPRHRGLGISIIASGWGIGGGILAGSATSLLAPVSWRSVFLVSVLPSIVISLVVIKFLPESRVWVALRNKKENRRTATFSDKIKDFKPFYILKGSYRKRIGLVFLVRALSIVLGGPGFLGWVVTYIVIERSMPFAVGAMWFSLFGVFGFLGNWINGFCADKLGRKLTIFLFFFCAGLSVLVFTLFARTETDVLFMTVPIGIALLGLYPTTFTLTAELLPPETRRGGSALLMLLLTPINFLLPSLIGIGATFFSIASCFSVIAVVAIILSIVLFYMIPETRGKEF